MPGGREDPGDARVSGGEGEMGGGGKGASSKKSPYFGGGDEIGDQGSKQVSENTAKLSGGVAGGKGGAVTPPSIGSTAGAQGQFSILSPGAVGAGDGPHGLQADSRTTPAWRVNR